MLYRRSCHPYLIQQLHVLQQVGPGEAQATSQVEQGVVGGRKHGGIDGGICTGRGRHNSALEFRWRWVGTLGGGAASTVALTA